MSNKKRRSYIKGMENICKGLLMKWSYVYEDRIL